MRLIFVKGVHLVHFCESSTVVKLFGVVHFSTPSKWHVLLGAALKLIWRKNVRIENLANDFE